MAYNIPVVLSKNNSNTTYFNKGVVLVNNSVSEIVNGINYAIENNGYNKYHKKQVLIREEHFKNVYGKNLWREKGGWMKIYNVSS